MKNLSLLADVIANPLIWMMHDPILLMILVIGVCVLTGFLFAVKARKRDQRD